MKNLESYGVSELRVTETQEVNGGFLGLLAGFLVGTALAMIFFDK
ncbi:hypothetical protein [uncultured Allomuricauda sp.]|nr:hypothetical protein [uncultured Allomuricauda sp.]